MSKTLLQKYKQKRKPKEKTFKEMGNPYGIFKNSKVSDKEIDKITSSWDKTVDELVKSLK